MQVVTSAGGSWGVRELPPNKSLQETFDPPRTFAVAKARVASNAPELGCYV
jgi:hypothetical protein